MHFIHSSFSSSVDADILYTVCLPEGEQHTSLCVIERLAHYSKTTNGTPLNHFQLLSNVQNYKVVPSHQFLHKGWN